MVDHVTHNVGLHRSMLSYVFHFMLVTVGWFGHSLARFSMVLFAGSPADGEVQLGASESTVIFLFPKWAVTALGRVNMERQHTARWYARSAWRLRALERQRFAGFSPGVMKFNTLR